MARTITNLELALGIGLIVLGVIIVVARFEIPFVAETIGVLMVATAVVFLYRGRLRPIMAFLAALGVMLLLADRFEDFGRAVNEVVSIVVGILVFLLGILVLLGKLRPKPGRSPGRPETSDASPSDP